MIHHICPSCGGRTANSDEASGMQLPCRNCGARILVPEHSLEPPPSPPPPPPHAWDGDEDPSPTRDRSGRPDSQADAARRAAAVGKWVALGLVPLFAFGVAWLAAGTTFWVVVGALVATFAIGLTMSLVGAVAKGHGGGRAEFLLVGYLALVLAIWFGVGFLAQVGTVHVENNSARTLRILVDGGEWLTCAPGKRMERTLGPGSRVITVLDADGTQLDELRVSVERKGAYVLNLLKAQTYHRGRQEYGGFGFGSPDRPVTITDAWFKADVDYLFVKPPESITVTSRRGQPVFSESKTYLLRGPAPKQPDDR